MKSTVIKSPDRALREKPGRLPTELYVGAWSTNPKPLDVVRRAAPAPAPMPTPPCLLAGSEAAKERARLVEEEAQRRKPLGH